jgi:hypothetical protein
LIEENGMAGMDPLGRCWRKSTRSGQRVCVEVAFVDEAVLTRDSKRPDGAVLEFSAGDWSAFLGALRTDRFIS